VRPLRLAVTARAYCAAPPGHRQPHGFAPATAAIKRGGNWRGVTVVIGPVARHRLRPRHIITLLAGRAYQLADRVSAPACHQCPGPVVRLPERRRIREPRGAARHVTPGSRYPDLITDDTVFGNGNGVSQRVIVPWRPWRPWRLSVRGRAHQSQCHHPAGPAPHSLRYGMPGHGPCAQPPPPPSCWLPTARQQDESRRRGAAPGFPERHRGSSLPAKRRTATPRYRTGQS